MHVVCVPSRGVRRVWLLAAGRDPLPLAPESPTRVERIGALRPGSFGPSLLTLWLFSNNLSAIYPGTFRHLQALEELDLGDNRHLRSLEPDTFQGLERLQSLPLYRCQLSSLPGTIFRGLVSLQYLYLQENSLVHLQDDLFADLANLSHLFLHGNRLRLLTEHVFRGLGSLDRLLLHGNRLQGVHRAAFRGLGRLTILYLFNHSLASPPGGSGHLSPPPGPPADGSPRGAHLVAQPPEDMARVFSPSPAVNPCPSRG
nr:PREDICTED: reticulon-4 receptor-like 2 [Bos mutus]